jgi:hypothetical protein
MSGPSLSELLGREFAGEYREDLLALLGPREDDELEAWVSAMVRARLGKRVTGALFATKSVGAVFGLLLDGGERVVLKIYHPAQARTELEAMERCHQLVVERGFPAPRAVGRLFETGDGFRAAFFEFLGGEMLDAHLPLVRRQLARALAQLNAIFARVDPSGLPLAPSRGPALWAQSQRAFLDIEAPSPIDEQARAAQTVIQKEGLPLIVSHLDWGTKNARFVSGQLHVVYDWDSLFAVSEAESAGRAAAQFTAQWDFDVRRTPTLDESRAFLSEYQDARGRPFTPEERRVAEASAVYVAAQIGRYEIASGASEGDNFLGLLRALESASIF